MEIRVSLLFYVGSSDPHATVRLISYGCLAVLILVSVDALTPVVARFLQGAASPAFARLMRLAQQIYPELVRNGGVAASQVLLGSVGDVTGSFAVIPFTALSDFVQSCLR